MIGRMQRAYLLCIQKVINEIRGMIDKAAYKRASEESNI
jgi:hypothetical protein